MTDLPEYVSRDRQIQVTVRKPDGSREKFSSRYDHIVFIDIREDGVWIRDENGKNSFYPSDRILELTLPSNETTLPDHLQKQRRH